MESIYGVELEITCVAQRISLPKNSKILCIRLNHRIPYLWFINPDISTLCNHEDHLIYMYDSTISHEKIKGKYIDSFRQREHAVLFFVFEEIVK